MRKINIIFSTPKKKNPLSNLITKLSGTRYSHVCLEFDAPKLETTLIYQASHTSVHFMGPEVFNCKNEIVEKYSIEISDELEIKLLKKAVKKAGLGYGWKGLIGLGLKTVFRLESNPFKDGGEAYVCAELVADLLIDAGLIEPIEDLDSLDLVTLNKLVRLIPNIDIIEL